MIREGGFAVMQDKQGNLFFQSDLVDLTTESLVFPIEVDGTVGTLEIWQNKAIIHLANGPSITLPPKEVVKVLNKEAT